MAINGIRAAVDCDKCGQPFTLELAVDAQHGPGETLYEIVRSHTDVAALPGGRTMEEAGYTDGEFYCPQCWAEYVARQPSEDLEETEKDPLRALGVKRVRLRRISERRLAELVQQMAVAGYSRYKHYALDWDNERWCTVRCLNDDVRQIAALYVPST